MEKFLFVSQFLETIKSFDSIHLLGCMITKIHSDNGNDLCQLFSNCMSGDGDGIPIGISDYRQCAAAWIQCHVQQKQSGLEHAFGSPV
jgi:hypothetical protein